MTKVLLVSLFGKTIGKLKQLDSGQLSFEYVSGTHLGRGAMPLSCSLPIREAPYSDDLTRAYFSGLLPDGHQLDLLAMNLKVSRRNPFALLEKVGLECAGAVQVFSEDNPPVNEVKQEALHEADLGAIIEKLKHTPLLAPSKLTRLSLAGAQSKMALIRRGDKFYLPQGSPSTHIIKPMITTPVIDDSVHNEYFCTELARMIGLNVPNANIYFVEDVPLFVIERYDRSMDSDGNIERIHQEDFCQASGVPPELKYQNEGGPSINASLNIIVENSQQPAVDTFKFIQAIIFNYLIGNHDAHGKNFSFLYHSDEESGWRLSLAPLYDLMSTEVYPLEENMAMKIGSKYNPKKVLLRHWEALVPDTSNAKKKLFQEMARQAKELPKYAAILEKQLGNNGINSEIMLKIREVIEQNTARMESLFR